MWHQIPGLSLVQNKFCSVLAVTKILIFSPNRNVESSYGWIPFKLSSLKNSPGVQPPLKYKEEKGEIFHQSKK